VQTGRDWNAATLAAECETTQRTIYRDLKELEGAGIPIRFDEKVNGYRVAGRFYMPPVHLTAEEALALAAVCEHIGGQEQIPLLRPAWRALHKIESQLPESIQQELQQLSRNITIKTGPTMPADGYADVYDTVQRAIAAGKALACCYESLAGDDTSQRESFEFHPYALFFSVRAWYVLGHHTQRDDLRCLKLNRFSKINPTQQPFQVPDDFSLNGYLGNAWRMIRDGEDVHVELWIDPTFAQTVSDTRWHHTQQMQWHKDDSCTLTFTVAGFSEIEWWILSMGPHCQVKQPPELAQRIRQLARQTAAVYDAAEQA